MIIAAGFCACFLPAIYLAFAVSLVGPIYLFERRNPIGRSFQLVHARFGMVLGRVAVVAGGLVAAGLVVVVGQNLALLAVPKTAGGVPEFSAGYVAITVAVAVLYLPVYLGELIGLLLTYTEQRGQDAPVTTAQLVGELG